MNRFDPSRFAVPLLAVASLVLLVGVGTAVVEKHRRWKVTIAAGGRSGESFVLAQALKTVVERLHSEMSITVRETGGTAENLALLERHEADFATAQADVPAGPSARLVAILYADAFQLLVPKGSAIRSFPDLAGKRIAVPTKGGQVQSFLSVAEHFGFRSSDFQFVDDDAAGSEFRRGGADALFRVRALGNPGVIDLARAGRVRIVPISQAAAMRIRIPAFEASVIPQGAYLGNPPIPEVDTPTVIVQRTLLARAGVPEQPVRWLTEMLIEHREEIAQAVPDTFAELRPLLAYVRKPEDHAGLGVAVHPGAQEYYEKDKPSFVQGNADFVALVVSLAVLSGSWIWELKRWLSRRQKNRADAYNHQIIELFHRAQAAANPADLVDIRAELMRIFTVSVSDLDHDRISVESFHSVQIVWQMVADALRERRSLIDEETANRT